MYVEHTWSAVHGPALYKYCPACLYTCLYILPCFLSFFLSFIHSFFLSLTFYVSLGGLIYWVMFHVWCPVIITITLPILSCCVGLLYGACVCVVLSHLKANVISSLTLWHRTAPALLMTPNDLTAYVCVHMSVCGLTSKASTASIRIVFCQH